MRDLKPVGLSEDGQKLVLVSDSGEKFAVPADGRLRAAMRGDRARLGQLEIEMDSALRPRDIQARIRSGETPEAVANLAQVSVDKIMPYCVPVLAERQHVADLARRSHVRRKNVEGPARRLTEVVAERLRGRSVNPESASWDAWRRDDGRWSIGVTYLSGERERAALFVFDSMGRYSVAEDDEAKWLTGERQSTSKGPQPRETAQPGDRRLSAVPDAAHAAGSVDASHDESDDLLSLAEDSDDLTAVVRAVNRGATPEDATDQTAVDDVRAEEQTDELPDVPVEVEQDSEPSEPETITGGQREPETEPTPERKRRGGRRASVPSWDEIMLGKRKDS